MQHQALKYAPSLVNDGRFSQGLSHWFGSYVSHVINSGESKAQVEAKLASAYEADMPFGISQFIDAPEIHNYPAVRSAQRLRMLPLGSKLALLVSNGSTLLQGQALVPGIEGANAPNDVFQHPFRWQDSEGALNILPTSSVSLDGDDVYSGEYRAGSLIVENAPTPQAVVHHRLYVAPEGTIPATVSSAGFGGVRAQTNPTSNAIMFLGDPTELAAVRDQINVTGVAQLTAVLNEEWQVQLVSVSGITTLSPGVDAFTVSYNTILGGSAPEAIAEYTSWALYKQADVDVRYTMPLYGYEYTLGYSYSGRTPLSSELTFRRATEGADGFTLSGFGEVAFRVASKAAQRGEFPGASGNYARNVEVLRAESRVKVIGRPMLTIPVVDATELQQQSRTMIRFAKFNAPLQASIQVDPSEVDADAVSVVNMRWEDGVQGAAPAKLYLGGIVDYGNLPAGATTGQSLGPVTFTGHIAGANTQDSTIDGVKDAVATLLYGRTETITAELFLNVVAGAEELYVQFYADGTPVYVAQNFFGLSSAPDLSESYTIDAALGDTLGIRGSHWGLDLEPQFPRISPGDSVAFTNAQTELSFLNTNTYTVLSVYLPTSASPFNGLSIVVDGVSEDDWPAGQQTIIDPQLGTQVGLAAEANADTSTLLTDISLWPGDLTNDLPTNGGTGRDLLERHTDPLDSLFPKGTVILYAGGGACPAGFKPVQATAEAQLPGVPGIQTLPPIVSATYDSATDMTTLEFGAGQLPLLRDAAGSPVSLESPTLTSFAAPSLEYGSDVAGRAFAEKSPGSTVSLSAVVQILRYAVEPGMTIRVEESSAEGSGPLVFEDRGFLVTGDGSEVEVAGGGIFQSALRAARPTGGGNGYHDDNSQDVEGPASINGPAYRYARGFGELEYPAVDNYIQTAFVERNVAEGAEGFNRPEDQALTAEYNEHLGLPVDSFLLPKYPTRFTQTPSVPPSGPGIWGQRQRFFYESPEQEEPTSWTGGPNANQREACSWLAKFAGRRSGKFYFDIGGTGDANTGVPYIPTSNEPAEQYIPNPAWDLSNPGGIDITKYPPIQVARRNDLVNNVGPSLSKKEGMVMFCRVYARCSAFTDGRPTGAISGWFDSADNQGTDAPFLMGTMLCYIYNLAHADGRVLNNINVSWYEFPGQIPPTEGYSEGSGSSWPAQIPTGALLQFTPAFLYGPANQPQVFGPKLYQDKDGQNATRNGNNVPAPFAQTDFSYVSTFTGVQRTESAHATSVAFAGIDALTVAGDLSAAETSQPRMFVEPSGYLKYGQTGASMDYGPGRHGHNIARNTGLLGSQNLAQPEASQDYLTSLPTNHGHGKSGDGRYLAPVANLFTSCIKL